MVDGLVELLIQLVHKISVRAERKVESEINSEFRRVHGKNGILVRLADGGARAAGGDRPQGDVPGGGSRTLADIIAEAKANEKAFNIRVRTKLRGSYSHHYRRGLPKLLRAVAFQSSNDAFRPVMDALELLDRYKESEEEFYDVADTVPLDHVVPDDWRDAVVDGGTGLVERNPMSCACWCRCARRSAAGRSGWRAATSGATPTSTFRAISRRTGMCTTRRCPSPATRPSSSPACRNATSRRWAGWTRR